MAAPPAIPEPVLESLRRPILDILRRSDLVSVSAKKVRKELKQIPDPSVKGRTLLQGLLIRLEDKPSKDLVDQVIMECFEVLRNTAAVPPPRKDPYTVPEHTQSNGNAAAVPRIALPGLGGIPGSLSQPPPSSGTSITSALAAAPEAPPSSSASTQRSRKHEDVISDEEVDIDASAAKRTSSGKKVIKKRKLDANGEPKVPNPNNPFNRPVILDDALSKICGGKEMPRFEITKKLWSYIKERSLQNPSNGRQILCDPALASLFGKDVVDSFEMAKLISPHVTKKPA